MKKDRQHLLKALNSKLSLVKYSFRDNDEIDYLKNNFQTKYPEFVNAEADKIVGGYAISLGELLEILGSGKSDETPVGIQICFGYSENQMKESGINHERIELILTPIFEKDISRKKYWTTCSPVSSTDVPCPPYVTDCKKGK